MKIALGTVYPFDESRVRGGVEAVALYLTQALAKRDDIDLHVVSCNRITKKNFAEKRGRVIFHWLATNPRLSALRAATIDAWRVRQVYEQIQPEVIHAQGFSEYALAAPSSIPLLLSIHGIEMLVPWMKRTSHFKGLLGVYRQEVGAWIARKSIEQAQGIVSNAGEYIPMMLAGRLKDKSTYSIFNPIADDFFRIEPFDSPQTPLILWVGVISERKNIVELVRVFELVCRQVPDACLKLIGPVADTEYSRRVKLEIKDRKLAERVSFLGMVDQVALLEAYRTATLFAVTSLEETAPMAIAQALSVGIPVVAGRVGGIPWMIQDGQSGYVVERQDTQTMASRLVELLLDSTKRQVMRQAAKDGARQRFAADVVAEKTALAYRELIEGN